MGMKFRGFGVCILAVAIGGASTLRADTVSLAPAKDNTLYENPTGARSNGAGPFMFAGRNSQTANSTRRALLAFDIAGAIPPGATIVSVNLTMTTKSNSSGATTIALHRVSTDWGEGTSDAGIPGGGGAPATPGGATWIHTFFNSGLWNQPGGDFEPASSADTPVVGVGPVTWTSTPALIANVQAWLDAPATDFGWILLGDETTFSTATRYATRENSLADERPRLTVEFIPGPRAIPTVSQWGLVIMLALLLTVARVVFAAPRVRRTRA